MRYILRDGQGGKVQLTELSFGQSKQAAAIVDAIGRLIPIEGVDYEVDVIFSTTDANNVSLNIVSKTDKGEWWKRYVMGFISKYPPTIEAPGEPLPDAGEVKDDVPAEKQEDPAPAEPKDNAVVPEVVDAEVVS